uniref:ABC transporter permease n=1 Tax=Trichogloeopsis pedicellata TaxID=1495610 RepID=A0A1G4P0A9_9FLOR|nr:Hypothetical protein ycf63 [Trichogloeopsis pedicellata]SCW24345.1 Hypothetical protein ycf63 [Trichogloeopsis pedicellata]
MYINLLGVFYRVKIGFIILYKLVLCSSINKRKTLHLVNQLNNIGVGSVVIVLLTSCFMGMIFTFQVARELTYLHAADLVGSILTVTFIRELSPVLTAIIVTGRSGSAYTAEIAAMQVNNQIDVLYVLHIDPIEYLVKPRIIACALMLPLLNILSLATSIASSIFIASVLYGIAPVTFVASSSSSIYCIDLAYSLIKTLIFGLIIGVISCTWGLTTQGGSISVGKSTTASVVTMLLVILVVDLILSLLMFYNAQSFIY